MKELFNKYRFAFIIIGLIIIGIFVYFFFFSYFWGLGVLQTYEERLIGYPSYGITQEKVKTVKQTEYEIKTGFAEIKSSNAENDYEKVKKKVEELEGWTETINKYESLENIIITASFKVPSEHFESFADWLLNNFDVRNTNFRFYRVSVERERDEIEVLIQALDAYDRLMKRAEAMSLNETTIDIIFRITERKLEVMRLLKSYGYSIKEVEKQANYSTVTISIKQDKEIKIMPEDKERDLAIKLRNSVNEIINSFIDLLTVPILIIVKVMVWIIYATIALIPIFIAYKIILKIFKKLEKRIG